MAEIDEQTKKEFDDWLDGRPDAIREMANKIPPWNRYRLKPTGQHCSLYSYSEDGTLTIDVDGHDDELMDKMNAVIVHRVFGIDPNDLEVLEP